MDVSMELIDGKDIPLEVDDSIQLRGSIRAILFDAKTGLPLREINNNNIVVTSGRAWILNQLQSGAGASSQTLQQAAFGTGTTAPVTSQTALVAEITRKAIGSFDNTNLTSNPPSFTLHVSLATNEANTTLGEVGLFNSSAGGTMIGRVTHSTIDKTTSNTFSISYTVSN